MIVKCIQIYDNYTKSYSKEITTTRITQNCHYNVLAIHFNNHGIAYQLIADSNGMYTFPLLARAQDFEVVSARLPSNWTMSNGNDESSLTIGPAKWLDGSLWKYSFWQEYDDATPRTLQCYKEEVMTIIKTDKEYIQQIISERSNAELTGNWHETMVPLFNEILAIK